MGDLGLGEYQEAAPIVPNGQTESLPQWKRLNSAIKGFLADSYGITDVNEYNDMLNDPALSEAVVHDLKCRGLI